MTLIRAILVVVGLLVFGCFTFAQNADYLVGTWELDNKDQNKQRSLVISLADQAISIKESLYHDDTRFSNEMTLFLDKRAEKNMYLLPDAFAPCEVSSKTYFKHGTLTRESQFTAFFKDGPSERYTNYFLTDEYRVSKDGKTLKVKTLSVTEPRETIVVDERMPHKSPRAAFPGGVLNVERVYKKQS